MSRRLQENIVATVVLAVFMAYLITTLSFGNNARLVPLPIAILGIVLVLIQLVKQNLTEKEKLEVNILSSLTGIKNPSPTEEDKQPSTPPPHQSRRETQAILFVIIFVGLILLLGPVVAVFLFSSGFLSFTGHYPPIKSIWFSALFSVALYLLFAVALQLQLYHGILAPLITP